VTYEDVTLYLYLIQGTGKAVCFYAENSDVVSYFWWFLVWVVNSPCAFLSV